MSNLKFEVGKRYRFADGRRLTEYCSLELASEDGSFICSAIGLDGDCMSIECSLYGISGKEPWDGFGFYIATIEQLRCGEVVEV